MKIGFRRRYSNYMFLLALIFGALVIFAFLLTGWNSSVNFFLLSAILSLAIALSTRSSTYFHLQEDRITVYPLVNLMRSKGQSYHFESTQDFELIKNRLYVRQNGGRKRIPISTSYVEPADWQAFLQEVGLAPSS